MKEKGKRPTKKIKPAEASQPSETKPQAPVAILVIADDWEGLYIKGTLICENHSLTKREIFAALKNGRIAPNQLQELNLEDTEWLERLGCLPKKFADIPRVDA